MNPPRVFFDLDGTLTDPEVGITRCIVHALENLKAPIPASLRWCIGPPLRESFCQLVGESLADQAVALYRERYDALGWSENSLYPQIVAQLAQLSEAGCELYVASSKPHVFVHRILDHFELSQFFGAVFGAELDGTRSDKGELLRYALNAVKASGTDAVMVGDRKHDVAGALANDIRSIGVTYGFGGAKELREAGCQRLVDKPDQLAEAILQA